MNSNTASGLIMKDKTKNILGVVSIKGGVGKTTTVANLGTSMVTRFNRRVLVVDGNLSAPNLGFHFGFVDPRVTLHDVLDERVSISDAVHVHDSRVHVIPASVSGGKVDARKLKHKVASLRRQYDAIILDSAPSLDAEIQAVVESSDELLIVSNLEFPTISTTLRTIRLAEELNIPIRGVVLNRVKNKPSKVKLAYVESALEATILATIPDDSAVYDSLEHKVPVVLHAPKSPASREFERLSAILLEEKYPTRFDLKELIEGLIRLLRTWEDRLR